MINLIIFLFILGILIVAHEFGHFIVARKVGVKVEEFFLGFGHAIFKKKKNDTVYGIGAIPLGGFVKLAGDDPQDYKGKPYEYLSKSPGERAAIIFFGPLFNYLLGIMLFWLIFVIGYPMLTTKVGGLIDGFGAKDAGIMTNDKIISVDGKKVLYWDQLQKIIQAKTNNAIAKISILRENNEITLDVKIKSKEFTDPLGGKHEFGLLGISPDEEIVALRHGIFQSLILSIKQTGELTNLTYLSLWRMITGKLSFRESMTGPLGIFYITSKAASIGLIALLHLMAVLSVSLGIFNLLPIPVLDGGHLFFLAVEKIRGRRLSIKLDQLMNRVGFTLLISLLLFVTFNDIMQRFNKKPTSQLSDENKEARSQSYKNR